MAYRHGNVYAIGTEKKAQEESRSSYEVLVVLRDAMDLRLDPYEASDANVGYVVSKSESAAKALAGGLHVSFSN